jgi:hypothetical protein
MTVLPQYGIIVLDRNIIETFTLKFILIHLTQDLSRTQLSSKIYRDGANISSRKQTADEHEDCSSRRMLGLAHSKSVQVEALASWPSSGNSNEEPTYLRACRRDE